jgi:integrase
MKANREHKVPLSDAAIDIIKLRMRDSNKDLLFPSVIGKKYISNMAMLQLMRRTSSPYNKYVPHGFRSTFRDWAAETGNYDQNVVEFCMAHKLHSRVEGAYMRSDLYYKRVKIINDWARYIT